MWCLEKEPMNVIPMLAGLAGRLSEAAYDTERTRLRELYGDSSADASAKRDQALAILFYRSGWTQEELAAKEGKSQAWVVCRLRFGRFLNFITAVIKSENLPKAFTEGRFRGLWEQTDKDETNERIRFKAVMALMKEQHALRASPRKRTGPEIVKQFGDGKWRAATEIAQAVGTTVQHLEDTLDMMRKYETYDAKCERRTKGREQQVQFRIFPKDRLVSTSELAEKLGPLIDGLIAEGKKNMATMSPGTVAMLAEKLRRQIDAWSRGAD
jgi:hypothetical protein